MEQPNEPAPLPGAVRRSAIPVDVFNPLLRSLLSWELVARVEAEDGTHYWQLCDAAQRQLDELTPPRRPAGSLAYLDHWCAGCRQQRLTHLRDGRYLCEPCERAEAERDATDHDEGKPRGHRFHDFTLRPRRSSRP